MKLAIHLHFWKSFVLLVILVEKHCRIKTLFKPHFNQGNTAIIIVHCLFPKCLLFDLLSISESTLFINFIEGDSTVSLLHTDADNECDDP